MSSEPEALADAGQPDGRVSLSGPDRVRALLNGYQTTCVLLAAGRLGLFTRLGSGPCTLEKLALELGAPPDPVSRLLSALVELGLVQIEGEQAALTGDGLLLVPGQGPVQGLTSLADLALLIEQEYLPTWIRLEQSVRDGKPAFPKTFGMTPWEHRRAHPELAHAFHRMTSGGNTNQAAALVRSHDFSPYRAVVDVGGGSGYLLAEILRNHPHTQGWLLDLPEATAHATTVLAETSVRCQILSGSFFETPIPDQGDLYILKHILHDWDDQACLSLLSRCREAAPQGAQVMIVEAAFPGQGPTHAMLDLHMLVMLGGRERSLAEYRALLESSGWRWEKAVAGKADLPDLMLGRKP